MATMMLPTLLSIRRIKATSGTGDPETSIAPGNNSSKIDEIRLIFSSGVFDIIGVSESWLKIDILDAAVRIDGYRIFRMDRTAGRGGGNFFGDWDCSGPSLLVGVLYLPYGNLASCEAAIGDLTSRYEQSVFVGNFNINLYEHSIGIRDLCSRYGLSLVHNSIPTHFTYHSNRCTLIDYFIVSDARLVRTKGQFLFPCLNSNHAAIYIAYDIPKHFESDRIVIRDYSQLNLDECLADIAVSGLERIRLTNNPDLQLQYFNDIVLTNFDRHVPSRVISGVRNTGWMEDKHVKIAAEFRDLAYRSYMEDRSQANWNVYCRYRNRLKRTIRKCRAKFYRRLFLASSPRNMWRELRHLGYLDDSLGAVEVDVDLCNEFFTMPPLEHSPSIAFEDYLDSSFSGFSLRTVDVDDIWSAICSIKSNAVGSDGVALKFIRMLFPGISHHSAHIFNTIITTSTFPSQWTCARIVPVPKIRYPQGPSDFRPISILPALSKVLEVIINNQLSDFLSENRLISEFQSGFRKGHSTTTLMVDLVDDIRRNLDCRNFTVLVLSFGRARLYADDLQIVGSGVECIQFQDRMNDELVAVSTWCRDNFIEVNAAKSKCITFNGSNFSSLNFFINNSVIDKVDCIKVLGFYVDNRLNFDRHINKVISNITFQLRRIYRAGSSLPFTIRRRIGLGLLMPHIMYGLEVFSGTSSGSLHRLKNSLLGGSTVSDISDAEIISGESGKVVEHNCSLRQ
ncbi:uncharacterized protein LOC142239626 [Haematobia irritans]|uniref:uncharacterized protein LOC142239626 n=1 Tax=Haematobia irritans TaxID=7368 RepID=UPI003F4FD7F6